MLNTTSSHLDKLTIEQLTCCTSRMVSTDFTNRAAWTPGVDDDRSGDPRPDITNQLEQFLVYTRALGLTANIDKQYEEMRVHVARLPRPDWVPCKGGARHDELSRVMEVYSLITREMRLRTSLVEFKVALAWFKREQDEAERCTRRVQRGEVKDTGEILQRAIGTLAEARWDAVQCSIECTSMMQELHHVLATSFYYEPPAMEESGGEEGEVERAEEPSGLPVMAPGDTYSAGLYGLWQW